MNAKIFSFFHHFLHKYLIFLQSRLFHAKKVSRGKEYLHTYPGWLWAGVPVGWLWEGYTCSEGREFESHHCILVGQFSHEFAVKIVMFVLKDRK